MTYLAAQGGDANCDRLLLSARGMLALDAGIAGILPRNFLAHPALRIRAVRLDQTMRLRCLLLR